MQEEGRTFTFKILEKNYPNELKHYAVLEILKNAQLKELEKLSLKGRNILMSHLLKGFHRIFENWFK